MKSRNLMIPALLAALALPAYAVDFDNNPPGPAGGPGTNWENPPGPMGGPGASPNKRLSAEQRQRLQAMSPQDRRAFMQEWRQKYGDCWRDRAGTSRDRRSSR